MDENKDDVLELVKEKCTISKRFMDLIIEYYLKDDYENYKGEQIATIKHLQNCVFSFWKIFDYYKLAKNVRYFDHSVTMRIRIFNNLNKIDIVNREDTKRLLAEISSSFESILGENDFGFTWRSLK